MAALEALILAEGDRTELGHRLRLWGAILIERSGLTRNEVLEQLKCAYAVRSKVAHGSSPSKKTLKWVDDERVSLSDFVARTEELVRLALKTAIQRVASGGSWPPRWDDQILEAVDADPQPPATDEAPATALN